MTIRYLSRRFLERYDKFFCLVVGPIAFTWRFLDPRSGSCGIDKALSIKPLPRYTTPNIHLHASVLNQKGSSMTFQVRYQESHLDRSNWDEGPWNQETSDKIVGTVQVEEAKYPAMLLRNPRGAWCGYVGVSEWHPWFEKGYQDLPSIEAHGGLTYSGPCSGRICHVPEEGHKDHVWWLGFDCGHIWDLTPTNKLCPTPDCLGGKTYRNQGYVQSWIVRLAEQAHATLPSQNVPRGTSEGGA